MASAEPSSIVATNEAAEAIVNTQSAEDALAAGPATMPANADTTADSSQAKVDPADSNEVDVAAPATEPPAASGVASDPALTAIIPPPPAAEEASAIPSAPTDVAE